MKKVRFFTKVFTTIIVGAVYFGFTTLFPDAMLAPFLVLIFMDFVILEIVNKAWDHPRLQQYFVYLVETKTDYAPLKFKWEERVYILLDSIRSILLLFTLFQGLQLLLSRFLLRRMGISSLFSVIISCSFLLIISLFTSLHDDNHSQATI